MGSNCGAMGQHSIKYVNGAVYWMGSQEDFVFDGTVKSLPCSVEDFVFTTKNGNNLGVNYSNGESVYAGLNHLYMKKYVGIIQKVDLHLMIDMFVLITKMELG